jgi:hypothetical protein
LSVSNAYQDISIMANQLQKHLFENPETLILRNSYAPEACYLSKRWTSRSSNIIAQKAEMKEADYQANGGNR